MPNPAIEVELPRATLPASWLEVVARFGQGGGYPGQFFAVHSIAVDSRGNIYTGETLEGKRLQRFVHQGM